MKHTFLYTGLLGTLLSVAANHVHAGDDGNVNVASYDDSYTVTRAAAPDPTRLRTLFHTSQFNVIDPLDEFSGRGWNGLTPLGATVTHEMREANERAVPASRPTTAKASASFEEEARAGLY